MRSDSGRTTSIWMDTIEMPSFPRLSEHVHVDVCVVGAGIAGMTVAYLLAKEGRQVLVLDDGPIGGGETGRTTAHITAALDDRYFDIEKVHGEELTRLAAESHRAAIDRAEEICREESIDCDFTRVDGYLFLAPGDDPKILDDELEATHRAGLTDTALVERAPIPSFDTGRCLHFPRQAQFHPLKFLAGLADAITARGGRIHNDTRVIEVEDGRTATVKTTGGVRVTADAVIVATNTPISDRVVTHAKQAPYRTFVIGARVPKGAVPPGLYWDTPDPYHYIRTQAAADGTHDVLIVGGEDHKTGQEDDGEERLDRLEAWTRERFPMVESIVHRWSGQVVEPADYMAFIGRNPGSENVFIITGDSGNGMTHGIAGAVLIADLAMGRDNPWAKLYDPDRVRLRSAAELAKENLNVAAQYVDLVMPGDVSDAAEIPPGEGRVMRRGLHPVAAYRAEDGTLHEFSAICKHLGCVVRWNSLERTWDCPCHGSRYDALGRVVNAPSPVDLDIFEG